MHDEEVYGSNSFFCHNAKQLGCHVEGACEDRLYMMYQLKLVTLDEHHQALCFICLPSIALVTTGFIGNITIFNTNTLHVETMVELVFENCTNGN